jgi:biopolymer transport protein ExbB
MTGLDFSLFTEGGPMMWVLLAMGVAGTLIFIERLLYLHRGQIRSTAFVGGIKNILAKRRLMEALTVCEETPGPVAVVVKAALLQAEADEQKMRLAVQEAALVEIPVLERRLGSIAAIAQVAPLVGLLGTVLGMIATFHAFMEGGNYATASMLAAGLWQALISTAGSLVVAIPSHLAYHFLSGRVRAIVRDVEWAGNEIMQYLLIEYRRAPGNGDGAATERPGRGDEVETVRPHRPGSP